MKQIQLSQFDPARLFTYVLSRLVESHGAELDRKERISSGDGAVLGADGSSSLEEIIKTPQRHWPSGITKSAEYLGVEKGLRPSSRVFMGFLYL